MSQHSIHSGPGTIGRLVPISWGVLLIIGVFAVYMGLLRNSMKNYTYDEQVEVARQCAQVVSKQLQADFQTLDLVASILSEQDLHDESKVLLALNRLEASGLYKRVALVLQGGKLVGSDIVVRNRAYLASALAGETGVSGILQDGADGEDVNAYYAPVYQHDRVAAVLVAVRNAVYFKPLLDITGFSGNAFFAMVDEQGAIISTSPHFDLPDFKNVFGGLHERNAISSDDLATLRYNMQFGKSSVFDITVDSKALYMSSTPIGVNSWSLLTFVPAAVVDQMTSRIFSGVIILQLTVIGLLSLLALYIFVAERKHRGDLRRSMRSLASLTENIPGGVLQCSDDGEFSVIVASDGLYSLLGMSPDELFERCGSRLITLIDDRDQAEVRQQLEVQLAQGGVFDISYRLLRADGERIWVHHRGQRTDEGGGAALNCVLIDETEAREALRSKLFNAQRHRLFFDLSDAILYEFDMRTGALSCSSSYTEKFGYPPATQNFPQSAIDAGYIHPDDISTFVTMYDRLYDGELRTEGEMRLRMASGKFLWCHIQNVAVLDEDNVCTLVLGKITDIDASKRQMESLRDGALRDPFTCLYNKVATRKLISEYLEEFGGERPGVLCALDLDKFKDINDTYGHMFGDKVLAAVADTLRASLPASSIIGRIGGDEFIAFIKNGEEGVSDDATARIVAALCSQTVELDGSPFDFSCSIGLACFPQDGASYDALYSTADSALYDSKKGGRGRCTRYSAEHAAVVVCSAQQDGEEKDE